MKRPQPISAKHPFFNQAGKLTEYGQATLQQTVDLAIEAYNEAITAQVSRLEALLTDVAEAVGAVQSDARQALGLSREATQNVDDLRRSLVMAERDWEARLGAVEAAIPVVNLVDFGAVTARLNLVETAALDAMNKAQAAWGAAQPETVANAFHSMNVSFRGLAAREYFVTGPSATVNLTASAIEAQAYTAKGAVVLPNTNYFNEADIK